MGTHDVDEGQAGDGRARDQRRGRRPPPRRGAASRNTSKSQKRRSVRCSRRRNRNGTGKARRKIDGAEWSAKGKNRNPGDPAGRWEARVPRQHQREPSRVQERGQRQHPPRVDGADGFWLQRGRARVASFISTSAGRPCKGYQRPAGRSVNPRSLRPSCSMSLSPRPDRLGRGDYAASDGASAGQGPRAWADSSAGRCLRSRSTGKPRQGLPVGGGSHIIARPESFVKRVFGPDGGIVQPRGNQMCFQRARRRPAKDTCAMQDARRPRAERWPNGVRWSTRRHRLRRRRTTFWQIVKRANNPMAFDPPPPTRHQRVRIAASAVRCCLRPRGRSRF